MWTPAQAARIAVGLITAGTEEPSAMSAAINDIVNDRDFEDVFQFYGAVMVSLTGIIEALRQLHPDDVDTLVSGLALMAADDDWGDQ